MNPELDDPLLRVRIAVAVARLRQRSGMTCAQFARRTGVNQSTVYRWRATTPAA